ncbi:hypothetical protein LZC95_40700 [Pendulispora brunnea]|uniref:Outer membrane protein beta-barrel domain-containing protein n=1 Tax=Pendulispora brunnea TaxID=2905690 RepID=A0ABZ2K5B5_9BACT
MTAWLGAVRPAYAENTSRVPTTSPESLVGRPHTIAELEAGIIALPNAPISRRQEGGETPFGTIGKGDATVLVGMHLLYRASPAFAFGAGFLLGPQPTSDTQYGGQTGLKRSHARSYLLVGGELRYIPFRSKTLEAWFGLTVGGVIIADRFSTDTGEKVPAILGVPAVTVRTEGYTVGVEVGGSWVFADRWVAGIIARTDRWKLPDSPQCTAIGDCGTLTGTVESIQFGLTIGYRIPL